MNEKELALELCQDLDLLLAGRKPTQKRDTGEADRLLLLAERLMGIDFSQQTKFKCDLFKKLTTSKEVELDDDDLDQAAGGLHRWAPDGEKR